MKTFKKNNIIAHKTSRLFNVSSAILAFLLWGGWAFYVNGQSNAMTGLKAAITQGTASALITLFMVRTVAWLYRKLPENQLRMILPALLTVCFTGSCVAEVHHMVGTPEIFYTIMPAISVAFLFCLYTTFQLHKLNSVSKEDAHE